MNHYLELTVIGSDRADVEHKLTGQAMAYFGDIPEGFKLSLHEVNVSPMMVTAGGAVVGYQARAYAKLVLA